MSSTPESRQPALSAHEALEAATKEFAAALDSSTDDGESAWLRQLHQVTGRLGEALNAHAAAAEGEGGSLEEILTQKPALEPAIQRQRREHAEIALRRSELETAARDQLAFDLPELNQIRLEAEIVLKMVELHVQRGSALLYEAFFQQEGGEEG